jgi:hypothetical protein
MSKVIRTNTTNISFDDFQDTQDHILDDEPDPAAGKQQEQERKQQAKMDLALAKESMKLEKQKEKEQSKEQSKASKERQQVREEAGLDGDIETQKTRAMICRYRNNKKFGPYLKDNGFKLDDKTLNKLDSEGLAQLLEKIQFAVCNKNSEGVFKTSVLAGLQGVEFVGENYLDFHITGLTASLAANEEFKDLLEEIMLENQLLVYTKPTWRLLYMILSTGMSLHQTKTAFNNLPDGQKNAFLTALAGNMQAQSTEAPALASASSSTKKESNEAPKARIGLGGSVADKFKDLL